MDARAAPKMSKGAGAAAVMIVLLMAGSHSGDAAVRLCEQPVSSGIAPGATEKEARKAALSAWRAKALQHGEAYASWRLAAGKLLKCLPAKGGGYECVARANPCTIEQAPDRRELRRNRIGV
ncbi:hypothetical protein [Hyphomicrobium sp.]|uniref:hypothetical protein n=1 Tax=Hyphomicrobium sp. TaxID=82 RepID=UPI003F71FE1F